MGYAAYRPWLDKVLALRYMRNAWLVTHTQESTFMSKKDIYIAKIKLELDALNLKMNSVELKAKEAREDARDKYNEEMRKLSSQSKMAMAQLEEIKLATEDTWTTLVAEMDKVRDAFVRSFHYFKSQM
jgi:hypothetical protein